VPAVHVFFVNDDGAADGVEHRAVCFEAGRGCAGTRQMPVMPQPTGRWRVGHARMTGLWRRRAARCCWLVPRRLRDHQGFFASSGAISSGRRRDLRGLTTRRTLSAAVTALRGCRWCTETPSSLACVAAFSVCFNRGGYICWHEEILFQVGRRRMPRVCRARRASFYSFFFFFFSDCIWVMWKHFVGRERQLGQSEIRD
jgi:hypothetical protein